MRTALARLAAWLECPGAPAGAAGPADAGPACAAAPCAQDVTAIAAAAMPQLSKLTRSQAKRAPLRSVTLQCR